MHLISRRNKTDFEKDTQRRRERELTLRIFTYKKNPQQKEEEEEENSPNKPRETTKRVAWAKLYLWYENILITYSNFIPLRIHLSTPAFHCRRWNIWKNANNRVCGDSELQLPRFGSSKRRQWSRYTHHRKMK